MRAALKHIASLILVPATRWYLRRERKYAYEGLSLTVRPGVFHPGFFHSTRFLLSHLEQHDLRGKSLLEVGSGSGLMAIVAAKNGALVTACDLNPDAVENTRHNAARNAIDIRVIHSDLFKNLGDECFDWITINPPYYAKDPENDAALAWNCGEHFEYFQKLFHQLGSHIHSSSQVRMVLTRGCDLPAILSIAHAAGFSMTVVAERKALFDGKDFIYAIAPM